MAMATLIDLPSNKVEVRADLIDQYEICATCNGSGDGGHISWGNLYLDGFQYTKFYRCGCCGGFGYYRR